MEEVEEILTVSLAIHDTPVTIMALMVDPERGKYLAFTTHNPNCQEISSTSREEAIGYLVLKIFNEK